VRLTERSLIGGELFNQLPPITSKAWNKNNGNKKNPKFFDLRDEKTQIERVF